MLFYLLWKGFTETSEKKQKEKLSVENDVLFPHIKMHLKMSK